MKYFDTHTHTNFEPLSDEFNEILNALHEHDIAINIVGCNLRTSSTAVEQAQQSDNLYCSIGAHPNDIHEWHSIEDMLLFLEQLYHKNPKKVVCIGECGLDYFYDNDEYTKQKQKDFFEAQIMLAHKLKLPIMLHIRDAHQDAQKIIQKHLHLGLTWIIHCFTSNITDAQKYVDLGCYLSIPGVVTFKNAKDLQEAVKCIPLNKLLTETDAPWLTPAPYRGKTNYPYYVMHTNAFLARLLNIDLNTLNKQLVQNSCNALKIKW